MADVIHEFTVNAQPPRVFEALATANGMEKWWTKQSTGENREGGIIRLYFSPEFDWEAKVTCNKPPFAFELQLTRAHPDWIGTVVRCELASEAKGATRVTFYHTGWREMNEHWRVSCFCWAMYLRILRRNLEYGEFVPYEKRLEV